MVPKDPRDAFLFDDIMAKSRRYEKVFSNKRLSQRASTRFEFSVRRLT